MSSRPFAKGEMPIVALISVTIFLISEDVQYLFTIFLPRLDRVVLLQHRRCSISNLLVSPCFFAKNSMYHLGKHSLPVMYSRPHIFCIRCYFPYNNLKSDTLSSLLYSCAPLLAFPPTYDAAFEMRDRMADASS